jgi:hypothetical protein
MPHVHLTLISLIYVPSDPTSNIWRGDVDRYFLNQLRFFLNQLRLRWRQCNISDYHHIKTTVDSLKSEAHARLTSRHITSRQLWSFKLVEDLSNQLSARSNYHSVLKDGCHDQSEQDVNNFVKKALPTNEIPMYTRQKLNSYGDLFILNTSPILWHQWRRKSNKKIKQLSAWSEQRHPISDW